MSGQPIDVRAHNRDAWNAEVAKGNRWTVAVSPEVTAAARRGEWSIYLTPTIPVPGEWFPPIAGCPVLCLASGGGQQGPVLAAAGARVAVFDNSPAQLDQDRMVAARDGLDIRTVEGDMADLSAFEDATFDLIVHPVSNTFAADVLPVWREAYRVLRPGGALLSGFTNPAMYLADYHLWERERVLRIGNRIPYADADSLSPDELARYRRERIALEYSHTLEDQIGGQLSAGFVLTGLFEDGEETEWDPLSPFMRGYIATRAVKPQPTDV